MREENPIGRQQHPRESAVELLRSFLWAESPDEVVDALADHLKSTLGFQQIAIYVLKTEREPAVAVLWQVRGPHQVWESVPIEGDQMMSEVLGGTEPIIVPDARTDSRTNKDIVEAKDARTVVFLPMLLADGSRYFLSTGTFGEESWVPDSDSFNYLVEVGYHTSLALDRVALSQKQVLFSAEKAQIEKLEMLGRMAGSGAHELRNLLTVISGYTALVSELIPQKSRVAAQIPKIEKAVSSAIKVVKGVLAFSHRSTSRSECLDLKTVLAELEPVLKELLGDQVELDLQLSEELGPVAIRRDDFEQLLIQLVANSADAMEVSGQVSIVVTRSGARFAHESKSDWICLKVRDNGPGLASETADLVFEPFFSTHPSAQHSGLGLSTCFGIVNQSGGHISMDSAPGKGTTVKVMLPVSSEDEPTHSAKIANSPASKRRDYSGALVRLCRDLLKAQGFDEILEASRAHIQEQLGLHSLFIYIARQEPPKVVELWNFLGNLDAVAVPQSFHLDQNKLALAALTSESTIVVPDARISPLTDKNITQRLGSRTLISVPLKLADGRRGALGTGSFGEQGIFDVSPDQLQFLETLAGLVVVAIDRRRILEEQRSSRRKFLRARHMEAFSRLGQGLADDIRNALTAIDGFTHLTQISLDDEHEAQGPLEKIEKASQRAARLLDKLVAFTRPELPTVSSFDLNRLIHSLRPPLQHLLGERRLEISSSVEPCIVEADWSQIEQVVLNLVFNAKEASETDSPITLSTELGECEVIFRVRDLGQGMSKEVQSMAFEPFFTTKPPGSGTGLGLPTCRRILSGFGGSISIGSSPSKGAEVVVRLPTIKEAI